MHTNTAYISGVMADCLVCVAMSSESVNDICGRNFLNNNCNSGNCVARC